MNAWKGCNGKRCTHNCHNIPGTSGPLFEDFFNKHLRQVLSNLIKKKTSFRFHLLNLLLCCFRTMKWENYLSKATRSYLHRANIYSWIVKNAKILVSSATFTTPKTILTILTRLMISDTKTFAFAGSNAKLFLFKFIRSFLNAIKQRTEENEQFCIRERMSQLFMYLKWARVERNLLSVMQIVNREIKTHKTSLAANP